MASVTKDNLTSVLKAIGEMSADGIMLLCANSRKLEYINNALAGMFDITHKTFLGEPAFFVNHIVPEDIDYLKSEQSRLLEQRKVEDVEFRVKQHDGYLRTLTCSCYLVDDDYIVGIFKDITHQREHENYIINYGAKKNTLLDMVTHNLSAPLTVSKNMIDSLESMVSEQDMKNISVHIQLIKENTRHCIELVNDFLQEEHMVSEHIFTKKNRFEVVAKVNTILERFQKGYPDYDFLFLRNIDGVYINNDDVKFLQVFNNLFSNAIKWSPTGSVIEIGLNDTVEHVTISVRDHGIGIPEHFKDVIFKKYTPASRRGLRGEVSMGMGLYICKKLVGLMEGTLTYESKENEGSTFIVTLPKNNSHGK